MAKAKPEDDKSPTASSQSESTVKVHDTRAIPQDFKDEAPKRTMKTSNQITIVSISGKDVRVEGGKFGDGDVIRVANKAKVTLNGQESALANLNNGDVIVLGNGRKNADNMNIFEYFKVDATRTEK